MNVTYSETFFSAQGEGKYIGHPSLWVRFFLCNLQCNGFGQEDPTNPETYELPYEKIDLTDITRVEDLPVFDKGCDSSYTWAKKFKHLMKTKPVEELVDELETLLPGGSFTNVHTGLENHMVFTGGEPMLNQKQMVAILNELESRNNLPFFVTVETNGTKPISNELMEWITEHPKVEWFWSISPKLWSTAGEKPKKALKPDVIQNYCVASGNGQLKFVVNGTKQSWEEVELFIQEIGIPQFTPWMMGVGGTFEGLTKTEADIADECLIRGYNYTSRVHVHIYGNAIGK